MAKDALPRIVSYLCLAMKKLVAIILLVGILSMLSVEVWAQCSICTKTAAQLGEKPARGLNMGILYLAATPITVVSIIAFRWWRNQKKQAQ